MLGPPGAGKTMLAERLPGLLPPLDPAAALEVTAVHSVAGLAARRSGPLVLRPPFQAPHHTASVAAIVGGGSTQVRPGVGVAGPPRRAVPGRGARVRPGVLDALRQPLESGEITRGPAGGPGAVPGPVPAGAGGQPVPVRAGGHRAGDRPALHLHADGPAALPGPAVRAAARPGRPAARDARGDPGRPARRGRAGRDHRGGGGAGGRGAGADGCTAGRHPVAGQRRGARPRAAAPLAAALGGGRRGRAAAGPGRADGARGRPGAAGRVDAGRPGRPRPARTPATSAWRWTAGGWPGGRRDPARGAGPGGADEERAARAALARLAEPGDPWLGRARGRARRQPPCSTGSGGPAPASPSGWRTTGSGCPRWTPTPSWPRRAGARAGRPRRRRVAGRRSTTWATGRRSSCGCRGRADLADDRRPRGGGRRGPRLHRVRRARGRRARGRARRPRLDRRVRAAPTASTPRRTGRAGRRRRRPWRCWPAGSTSPTRRRTTACSRAVRARGCGGVRAAAGCRARPASASSTATG